MKIMTLPGKKWECDDMIPAKYVHDNDIVMLCREDSINVGAAVLMQREDDWVLNWLWVLPEARKRGYGSALLDGAIAAVEKLGGKSLDIYINQGSPDSDILLCMLAERNFFLSKEHIPKVSVTREQLKKAIFFTDSKYKHKGNDTQISICSLRQVNRQQLEKFISISEKRNNYLASRADYNNADIDLSFFLLHDDAIVGALLIHPTGLENEKILSLCCVDQKYMLKIVSLFRTAAEKLLKHPSKIERFSFCCVEENVVKLVEYVLPEKDIITEYIIVGERLIFDSVK